VQTDRDTTRIVGPFTALLVVAELHAIIEFIQIEPRGDARGRKAHRSTGVPDV